MDILNEVNSEVKLLFIKELLDDNNIESECTISMMKDYINVSVLYENKTESTTILEDNGFHITKVNDDRGIIDKVNILVSNR